MRAVAFSSLIYSRARSFGLFVIVFIAVAGVFAARISAQTAPSAGPAQKLSIASLPNAACINPTLCRGAQPKPAGYAELKKLGVEVIVDFRTENNEIQIEQGRVESLGMRFVNLPWSSWHDPRRDEIISFFSLLRENPGKKVFVHCEYGADRTGLMIALYRVVSDHWSPEEAIAEMKAFNFHYILYAHLAKYVRGFPAYLNTDPALAAIISAPKPPAVGAAQPSSEHFR